MKFPIKVVSVLVVLHCQAQGVGSLAHDRRFHRGILCDVPERIGLHCMQSEGSTSSGLHCATRCSKHQLSVGYSVNGTSCFVHFECPSAPSCGRIYADHFYYQKTDGIICYNGGEFNANTNICKCFHGWIGQFCQTRAKKCRELYDWDYPYGVSDVYLDLPSSTTAWRVICFRKADEVRTYVFYHHGYVDFNRTWTEYEMGFFDDSRANPNFFIGLKPMHLINKAGLNELALSALFWNDPSNKSTNRISRIFQYINGVELNNSTRKYKIHFTTVTLYKDGGIKNMLTQGDCMEESNHMPFSTKDAYNQRGDNLAASSGRGWWFASGASSCNFLGQRCSSGVDIGPRCISVAGISESVVIPRFYVSQLFFNETY